MPTKSEIVFREKVRALGCYLADTGACWEYTQIQHVTSGGRKMGERFIIPLCKGHHHWDSPLPIGDCFGKGSKPWEEKHGRQVDMILDIWERVQYAPTAEDIEKIQSKAGMIYRKG